MSLSIPERAGYPIDKFMVEVRAVVESVRVVLSGVSL